jgi:carotenoid cleavage dioxygenase-like enzyme
MHPHFDQATQELLTYTFKHSAVGPKKTHLFFYSFDQHEKFKRVDYTIEHDHTALHMFGFTEHYYIIFANSLQMGECGTCKLLCGTPILRNLNDSFCGDLKIHFVPRDKVEG